MERTINIILYVLLLISLVLAIAFYAEGPDPADHPLTDPPVFGDLMIRYGYFLLFIATAVAIVFPIISMAKNPKGALKPLMGIGALAVVLGISYAMADSVNPSDIDLSESGVRMVGMGLFAFYALSIIAIGSLVYSEVAKMFK